MATLTVTPNPADPNTIVTVTGSGFTTAKTRLLLDGAIVPPRTDSFRPRQNGTFTQNITVSSTPKTQTLVAQQLSGKAVKGNSWDEVTRTNIVVSVPEPPPGDTTGPVISDIAVSNITLTSATVSWSLDEPATGQVEYGLTTAYGALTAPELSYDYSDHVQIVSGLTANRLYHFRVRSADAAGNLSLSADGTFITLSVPAAEIPGVPLNLGGTVGATTANLTWQAPVSNGGSAITGFKVYQDDSLVASPTATLYTVTGLSSGTPYTFTVSAVNAIGEGPQTAGLVLTPTTPAVDTFYVSPTGSDTAAGTSSAPWKTFRKAALTLTAGQTAVFLDGIYSEPLDTTVANSGTSTAPITFKAQNSRGARLVFVPHGTPHIQVLTSYITIRDLEITATGQTVGSQQEYGIRVWLNANFAQVINCKIWGTNWCIKGNGNDGLYEDNELISTGDGCFVCNSGDRNFVHRNNIAVNNAIGEGVNFKGGSKDGRVWDNYIHTSVAAGAKGIRFGGSSNAQDASADPSGYETYSGVAWNNVVAVDGAGLRWNIGLGMCSSTDCAYFNNVVIGANYPIVSQANNGTNDGWTWTPPVNNPTWVNNIVVDGNDDHFIALTPAASESGSVTIDHNLFYNTAGAIGGNLYATTGALFVSKYADWHLASGCVAINSGVTGSFTNSDDDPVDMTVDRGGTTRTVVWSMGVYD